MPPVERVGDDVTTSTTSAPARRAATTAARGRWGWVDALRGVAIVAVVAYHLQWDLASYGYAGKWTATPTGKLVGHLIAGTFLFLVGVSFALAHRRGFDGPAHLRRLAKLVAAAGVITAVSWVTNPQAVVTFGILHAIALTSVLLIPFLRWSDTVAVVAAAVSFALPAVVQLPGSVWWGWLGLSDVVRPTLDHQPLFPMFGLSLLGLVLARRLIDRPDLAAVVGRCAPAGSVGAGLRFLGRHTLAIYLLHQPVLIGIFELLARR